MTARGEGAPPTRAPPAREIPLHPRWPWGPSLRDHSPPSRLLLVLPAPGSACPWFCLRHHIGMQRASAPGSRLQAPGSRLAARRSVLRDQGSGLRAQGSGLTMRRRGVEYVRYPGRALMVQAHWYTLYFFAYSTVCRSLLIHTLFWGHVMIYHTPT